LIEETGINTDDTDTIKVITKRGEIPFSVGYLAETLLAIGITEDQAYSYANTIYHKILKMDNNTFTADEVLDITGKHFEEIDLKLSKRVQVIKKGFSKLKPLIILFGGVTGIGKSTLAQIFTNRMGFKLLMGTDLIREVMRMAVSPKLMPTLHTSSYVAHLKLDTSFLPALSKSIVGFEEQARSVIVGIEAAIDHAINDNEILVVEGVHLVPGLLKQKFIQNQNVILIQLSLKDENVHRSRLTHRETVQMERGTNYLEYFNEIREIQQYLLDLALKNEVPIVEVDSMDEAIINIINLVWDISMKNIEEI